MSTHAMPEWLSKELFCEILKKQHEEENSNIKVLDLKISQATAEGEHYASLMYRCEVEYQHKDEKKSKSMIVKAMPDFEGHQKDMLEDSRIFETEIAMYTEVIPRIEAILGDVGDKLTMAPACLYSSLSPRKFLVLEDMQAEGYLALRDRPMTFEELKAAYIALGKWHAVSFKINLEEPNFFNKYRYGFLTNEKLREQALIQRACDRFIEMLETQPDLVKFKPHILQVKEDILEKCVASFTEFHENPHPRTSYVLCHGDFHCRNMLFRYENGTNSFKDLCLLDFQYSYMGPIVNDVLYSVFMLLDKEARERHVDELMKLYFSTFEETLKKLRFEGVIPAWTDFQRQLNEHKYFELFLLIAFLPTWYSIIEGPADFGQLLSNEDYCKRVWMYEKYVAEVRRILPLLIEKYSRE